LTLGWPYKESFLPSRKDPRLLPCHSWTACTMLSGEWRSMAGGALVLNCKTLNARH
jgi:hypothetical protein